MEDYMSRVIVVFALFVLMLGAYAMACCVDAVLSATGGK